MRACCVCNSSTSELRPYGKNGSDICFSCMKSSPEREQEAGRQFEAQVLFAGNSASAVLIGTDAGPIPYFPSKGGQA